MKSRGHFYNLCVWAIVPGTISLAINLSLAHVPVIRALVTVVFGLVLYERFTHSLVRDCFRSKTIEWEHSLGPIFAGGCYRESAGDRLFDRWVGIGRPSGPNLSLVSKRRLGSARPRTAGR